MPIDYNYELRLAYLRAAQAAQEEIEDKIQVYRDYFDGDQDIELTDRQKEYLTQEVDNFGNICKRVVSIPKDRLQLDDDGISPAQPEASAFADEASKWWKFNRLQSRQKEVYESSLRDGSVALVVGYDEVKKMPTFTPNLVYDGATGLIRFHYDSDDNLLFASKRWTTWNPLKPKDAVMTRTTIYRPDMIDRYISDGGSAPRPLTPEELGGIPNPQPWVTKAGEPVGIPVIPFENPGGSELTDVVILQQLLNHNLGTFDISVDFHAFPLLWFAGLNLKPREDGEQHTTIYGPGQAISLTSDGSAGRIEPADLKSMFEAGVLSWIQVLAIIKGWPLFALSKSAEVPSGVALQTAEAGLVKQIEDKQAVFSDAWRDAFEVGRKLHELAGNGTLEGDLDLKWVDPATTDELSHYQALQAKYEALQIPLISRWREEGYTQEEIDQMLADSRTGEEQLTQADIIPRVGQ